MASDSVALCFYNTAFSLQQAGFQKVVFFLDQNPTHKNLMKYNLALLPKLPIEISFEYIPAYSPKLNIVEFLIHLIRQKKLHHATHKRDLKQIVGELTQYLQHQKPFSQDAILNILEHIRLCLN
jgi:transposase